MRARHQRLALLLGAVLALGVPASVWGQGLPSYYNSTVEAMLLEFKASFLNGEEVLSDWNTSSYCDWRGVYCDGAAAGDPRGGPSTVTTIDMAWFGLAGTIPAGGWKLPETLDILTLQGNSLNGTLPSPFILVPDLQTLDLSSNRLSGQLTWDWRKPGEDSSLSYLLLRGNELSGSLPANLTLSDMVLLDLAHNHLTGTIPPELLVQVTTGSQTQVQINLQQNDLEGTLPALPNLTATTLIYVKPGNNALCGEVPNFPGHQSYMRVGDGVGVRGEAWGLSELPSECQGYCTGAGDTCDSGCLCSSRAPGCYDGVCKSDAALLLEFKSSINDPNDALASWQGSDACSWDYVQCTKFGEVSRLDLSRLGLSGTIPQPDGWTFPVTLQTLLLSDNRFKGSIPAGFQLPPSLFYFSIAGNLVTGSIDSGWELPDYLSELDLSDNRIQGQIPEGWTLPASLPSLKLAGNMITSLPKNWTLPSGLQELHLQRNRLAALPTAWAVPSTLEVFNVAYNNLSGPVNEAWLTESLTTLSLSHNNFSGTLPRLPPQLTVALLDGNRLQGQLYKELPWPLRVLNLTSNALSGPLPAKWSGGDNLESLLLAFNQFDALPKKLELPETVLAVDLSHNRLEGNLSGLTLPANLTVLRLSQNRLRGPLPQDWLLPGSLVELALDSNALSGTLPAAWSTALSNNSTRVTLFNNSLTGPLPAWSRSSSVELFVTPGNEGLCGQVPESPLYMVANASAPDLQGDPLESLPKCPPPPDTSSSGSSTGMVVGSVVGAAAALALLGLLGWWLLRRRQRQLAALAASKKVSAAAWTVKFENLELQKELSRGAFGVVWAAKWMETLVVVKILMDLEADLEGAGVTNEDLLSLSNPILSSLQEEADLMARLRHPNICQYLAVCLHPPAIITEFCQKGSLYKILEDAQDSLDGLPENPSRWPAPAAPLNWRRRLLLAMDAAKGMLYLHTHDPPILHRDLKSPNLVVKSDWTVKVCDFNLSRVQGDSLARANSEAPNNPRWMAPELLEGEKHSFASDVYAFGIVLYELYSWELPWRGYESLMIAQEVLKGERPMFPSRPPGPGSDYAGLQQYKALASWCWAQQPEDRPSFTVIIAVLRELLELAL